MIEPDSILPAVSLAAGALLLTAAMILAYLTEKARDCVRAAIFGTMSALFSLSGAALIFGRLLSLFLTR